MQQESAAIFQTSLLQEIPQWKMAGFAIVAFLIAAFAVGAQARVSITIGRTEALARSCEYNIIIIYSACIHSYGCSNLFCIIIIVVYMNCHLFKFTDEKVKDHKIPSDCKVEVDVVERGTNPAVVDFIVCARTGMTLYYYTSVYLYLRNC